MTEPTDAELLAEWDRVSHIADAGQRRLACLRAVIAKWGTPPEVEGELVFAFRRKGLDDFCTCTEERYAELSANPNLFETRIFYTTQQPTQAQAIQGVQRQCGPQANGFTAATVIKKGAERQWMSERLGHLPDGIYSLYLAPPTQAQAGAVPLTDEQIEALPMWKRFVGLWPETRREIVRTIERHHGIKGG